MSRHLLQFSVFAVLVCFWTVPGISAPFEVTNIKVSVQAENAVKAKDLAITKAQRVAFATVTGSNEQRVSSIADTQIARLVRGFSVRGERSAAKGYTAIFTIRFNPGLTHNFALTQGFEIVPQALQGEMQVDGAVTVAGNQGIKAPASQAAQQNASFVVLPVLDIGSRKVLWDEPNPWRDSWHKAANSATTAHVTLPMGDISDVSDIPDASLIEGKSANVSAMLERYHASRLYVVMARSQNAGMGAARQIVLSLYRHEGKTVAFIGKTSIQPRPGYLFDDALPAAMRMIEAAQNGQPVSSGHDSPVTQQLPLVNRGSASVTVIVPYQSLQQWVGIQNRLRLVQGVTGISPIRVSPSSAQVRIGTNTTNATDLKRNMLAQGFDIGKMPNGEMALTEK